MAKDQARSERPVRITTATYGSNSAATISSHMITPWPTITAATKQTVRMPMEMM